MGVITQVEFVECMAYHIACVSLQVNTEICEQTFSWLSNYKAYEQGTLPILCELHNCNLATNPCYIVPVSSDMGGVITVYRDTLT